MTDIIIGVVFVIFLGGVFYYLARQFNRHQEDIGELVRKEATIRGFEIKNMVNPSFSEWPESPFENAIKIGKLGFEGIPYHNREYYRVLICRDLRSNLDVKIWVRVTQSNKTKQRSVEWVVI